MLLPVVKIFYFVRSAFGDARLPGLLIKACQYMSALVGVLPDSYCEEFITLTEYLPTSSIDEVKLVMQRDLERSASDIFEYFAVKPIASASVAQVHRPERVSATSPPLCEPETHFLPPERYDLFHQRGQSACLFQFGKRNFARLCWSWIGILLTVEN